jgi:hypothetical protein
VDGFAHKHKAYVINPIYDRGVGRICFIIIGSNSSLRKYRILSNF